MHPLVGYAEELRRLAELTQRVWAEEAPGLAHLVGTMIEVPRACVRAGEIAEHAEFFSFGTNDLTQTALGVLARRRRGQVPDASTSRTACSSTTRSRCSTRDGVGELMRIAVEQGRGVKPDLKIGICGEHGGEPRSVAFCHGLGLDYVSCSPFRVPFARLAAAQAAIAEAGTATYVAAGG